ncbi:putative glycosyl hydrolase [Diaporthe ampelina]|uniref:Putative glycosyl hydrolase n=1 Tax=Diaporthe ampelina TaxID=1214573 RepID=A0A0G2HND2_9PEZI|nr:putative glycosyl hydrolase [Diaporthe ampelina]
MSTTTTAVTSSHTHTKSLALTRVDDLPASTVQCHASNLLKLPDGTLLCAWFGGTQEGTHDISIYLSRLAPGPSSSWAEPVRVSADKERSEQNPVLFRDPATGTVWLFHTAQPLGNQDEAVVIARTSSDGARTWSAPFEPFPGKKGVFVRQPLVVLPGGTWVLPIWYCRTPPGFRWVGNDDVSAVLYTHDGGRTWLEKEVPDSVGRVHMNILQLDARTYVAFFRSRWADEVYRSVSENGLDWSAPEKTPLPNPNSGTGAAALPNGDIAIIFNDSRASPEMQRRDGLYDDITPAEDTRSNQPGVGSKVAIWGTPRKALSVALSKDKGKTWKWRVLEDGDGFCMTNNSKERTNRELSYPSIFVDGKGENGVHVAYTYYRRNIKYVYIRDIEEFVSNT